MKKIFVFVCVALCLCACSPSLVILHVNDTHSHVEPVRGGDNDGLGGIIERGALVDSIRNARGAENVLLLHAGDFNQGSSYYTVFGGAVEVAAVNSFGYDCVTLGNHEFDNGIKDLASRLAMLEMPVVCCNISLEDSPLAPYVKPYTIVHKAGRKIGVIGVTADLSTVVAHDIVAALKQPDPIPEINKWAAYLRSNEKCDMVILLSHQGYREDIRNMALISGVDLVVGGHSHTFMDDFKWVADATGKQIPIIQDGCWGMQIGEIVVR